MVPAEQVLEPTKPRSWHVVGSNSPRLSAAHTSQPTIFIHKRRKFDAMPFMPWQILNFPYTIPSVVQAMKSIGFMVVCLKQRPPTHISSKR